jgi:hypothetical protein
VVAQLGRQAHARGFDEVLSLVQHWLGSHAGAADLRHGVEQHAAAGFGQSAVVKGQRPLLMAMPQVSDQARHVRCRQRFTAKLLQHLEQHARQWLHRAQVLVQVGV